MGKKLLVAGNWLPSFLLLLTCGCTGLRTHTTQSLPLAELHTQVETAERGFAATMAQRDFQAFLGYVSDEALFFGGGTRLNRGRDAVGAAWRAFFDGAVAPFSWEPDRVEVLASGTLALSTGPVKDSAGKISSRFNSIWRREADGRWRVVFDRGQCLCGN